MEVAPKKLNSKWLIHYGWYLLIGAVGFSLPFSPRMNSLFIVLLFIYWLIFQVKHVRSYHFKSIPLPFLFLLCFYIWGVLSLLYTDSQNIVKAYHIFVENRLPLILLPLIFLTRPRESSFIVAFYSFLLGISLFCLGLNFKVLYQIYIYQEPLSSFYIKYVRTRMLEGALFAIHSMYLSMMLLLALVFNCYFALYSNLVRKAYIRKCLVLISVYFLIMLFLIGARISILSLGLLIFIGLLYCVLKFTRLSSSLRFLLSFTFTSVLVLLALHFRSSIALKVEEHFNIQELNVESIPSRTINYLKEGDRARGISWQSAIDVIKENFWFGVGGGDSLEEMQKKRPTYSWSYQVGANAHNQYLDTTVQLGIVGLFFWLAFYFGLMHHGLKQRNALLIIFLLVIGIALITESMLQEHRGLVFISFFAPLLTVYNPDTYSR